MVQLEELFEQLLTELPTEPEASLTLNATTCVRPPSEIETQQLKVVAWPLGHIYGDSARYDLINFFADKSTYRRLGLLLFSSLFHPSGVITLHLRHPETNVTKVRIECGVADPFHPRLLGLITAPIAYGYSPAPPAHLHPLWREDWRIEGPNSKIFGPNRDNLPCLTLTNEAGMCGAQEEFVNRTVVDGFGNAEATVTLAALLLDIGLPQTELSEFCLESPSGNWSVAIGSSEARFWIGYDYQ